MLHFRLRIEETNSRFDDQSQVRTFAHLNGHTFTAVDYDDATRQLRALGLDVGHGLGVKEAAWAYPVSSDKGFTVWFLTGAKSRTLLGNNSKLQQLRSPE